MNVLDIVFRYRIAFLNGLETTFQLAIVVWVVGLVFGTVLGALGAKWKFALGAPIRVSSFALSGMPLLVFLFWFHYPLQSMLGVVIDPFVTAALTLSIINCFAVADVVRGVLADFPKQYLIAAQVCGMGHLETMRYIQIPIVFRQTLPVLLTLQVSMLQATLFASLISVNEIFRVCQQINSQIYKPVEIYTALGLLFLSICLPLNGLALYLKARYTRDFSER